MKISRDLVYLLIFDFIVRFIQSLLIRTTFWPDEYWQSLEISHLTVFHYGFKTWEWGPNGIRSYISILPYMLLYQILKWFKIDTPFLVHYMPRFLHVLFTILSDYFIIQWNQFLFSSNKNINHKQIMVASYYVIITNFYISLFLLRTISNSLIYYFVAYLVYKLHYPLYTGICSLSQLILPFILISLCIYIRMDSVVVLLPLCLNLLYHIYNNYNQNLNQFFTRLFKVLFVALCIFIMISILVLLLDFVFYHQIIYTLINSYVFNIYNHYSTLYGKSHFFNYFIIYIPLYLNLSLFSLFYYRPNPQSQVHKKLLYSYLVPILIYSLIDHKEDRFILPLFIYLYPILTHIFIYNYPKSSKLIQVILHLSCFLFIFFACFYQRGPEESLTYLSSYLPQYITTNHLKLEDISLDLLLECHHTPSYSYLHSNITIYYPECLPLSRLYHNSTSDLLYNNTELFFSQHYNHTSLPHFILTDSYISNTMKSFFSINQYYLLKEWIYNPIESLFSPSPTYIQLFEHQF